jgi:hypothetical protein
LQTDLFGAPPSGRTGRLDNAKETMMQFWSEPTPWRSLSNLFLE